MLKIPLTTVPALILAAVFSTFALAFAASPSGTIVLARAGHAPVLIWDATPAVIDIVHNKTSDADALKALSAQAAQIDLQRFKRYPSAQQITVRVIYQRAGSVSPVYGSPTFGGVESLLNVTLRRGQQAGAARVAITGKLPPH